MEEFLTISEISKLARGRNWRKQSKPAIWRFIKKTLKSENRDKVKIEKIEQRGFRKSYRFLMERDFILATELRDEMIMKRFETIKETIEQRGETKGETIAETIEKREETKNETIKLETENEFLKQNIQNREELISELKGDLKEERTKSYQTGLQMGFLKGQNEELRKLLEAPKLKSRWAFWKKK